MNTIIANGSGSPGAVNCGPEATGDLADTGGNLQSQTDCGFSAPTSQSGVDPQLGALTDNGGQTDTMKPASAAVVGKAVPAECESTDQRGGKRLVGGVCDVGAVELDSLADLTVKGVASSQVAYGGTLSYELTVTNQGPDNATGVVLSQDGNAAYKLASSSVPCSGTPPLIRCEVGALAAGASTTVTVKLTALAVKRVSAEWFAGSADQNDPNQANSSASFITIGAPTITGATLSKRSFRPARSGKTFKASVAAKKSGGTVLSYTSVNAAKLKLDIVRTTKGRLRGSSCRKLKRGQKSNCTIKRVLNKRTVVTAAAKGKLRFSGRIAGRALRPGRYTLEITPLDESGAASANRTLGFRIKR